MFVQRCVQVPHITFLVSVQQIGKTGHLPSVEIQHHYHVLSEGRSHPQVESRLVVSNGSNRHKQKHVSCLDVVNH